MESAVALCPIPLPGETHKDSLRMKTYAHEVPILSTSLGSYKTQTGVSLRVHS